MDISVNQKNTSVLSDLIRKKIKKGITHSNANYLAERLGAHVDGANTNFMFWHPQIKEARQVVIEILVPVPDLIFDKPEQHSNVTYYRLEAASVDELGVAVVENLPVGNRDRFGAFYQFVLQFEDEEEMVVRDPMAWSMPYGIHAPAEVYDIEEVLKNRKDIRYFKALQKDFGKHGTDRVRPSTNLLEIHTGTATMEGTLQSLSNRYRQIASKIENDGALSTDEKNLIGFDGVELMPVDPVVEHPQKHAFWRPIQTPAKNGSEITIHLRKPNVTNWGYDVAVFGSAAINPSILSTGRPHELLDLIETLHNFPEGGIRVILDVVYGHADNRAEDLLPGEFFAGENAFGKNLNFRHPLVRAVLLEMLRRKMSWGFDGIRVDSAHDFTYYDEEQDEVRYDNEFLNQISNIELEVEKISYKPWMIFEDGRPWPRDDWELAATYREIIDQNGYAWQWAPTIFAYNTPYSYTYWVSKWWRLKELLQYGDRWITGYANHDTIRRGTQADPDTVNVNHLLGNSLKMVMVNAYNSPATTLLMNAFLPGVPMDFLQALGNTPWSFVRNTDAKHAVKVVAEEAFFSEWQMTEVEYRNSRFFKKLKNLGFRSLSGLRRFARTLQYFGEITEYDTESIAILLNQTEPQLDPGDWSAEKLQHYAEAWMADLHEYCNVDVHADHMDQKKAEFNLKTRQYRLKNPWIKKNFGKADFLRYRDPVAGTVIFYGYRKDEQTGKELIFLANMEGQPRQLTPTNLELPVKSLSGWEVVLSTPSVRAQKIDHPLRLSISQGILFEKNV